MFRDIVAFLIGLQHVFLRHSHSFFIIGLRLGVVSVSLGFCQWSQYSKEARVSSLLMTALLAVLGTPFTTIIDFLNLPTFLENVYGLSIITALTSLL